MKKTLVFVAFLLAGCTTYSPDPAWRFEHFPKISSARIHTEPAGPTVRITRILNLDPEPIEAAIMEELLKGGYSLVSDAYAERRTNSSPFNNSYWENAVRRNWGGSESDCHACDRVDYLLEIGARPVSGGYAGGSVSGYKFGYGTGVSGERAVNEVEIYITFYDGRTKRAVPGKSSRVRMRVRRYGSVAGEIITRTLGVGGFASKHIYDPVTEAAIQAIPFMFEYEGR